MSQIYIALLFLSGLISIALVEYIRTHNQFPGRSWLIILLTLIVFWCFFAVLELTVLDTQTYIWTKLIFLIKSLFGVIFVIFMAKFCNYRYVSLPRVYNILFILPVIFLLFAVTNHYHHLVWRNISVDNYRQIIIIKHGLVYIINLIYLVGFIIWGSIILLDSYSRHKRLHTKQFFVMALSILFPSFSAVIYMLNLTHFRIVPISVLVSVSLMLWGFLRLDLFDLVVIARNKIIDIMKGAVIVLDSTYIIRDINPSVTANFGIGKDSIGKNIFEYLPELNFLQNISDKSQDVNQEIFVATKQRWFDMTCTFLGSRHNFGMLIIMRDFTTKKEFETILCNINDQLTQLNEQKNKLFSILAHDIRNPIHQILGFCDILKTDIQNGSTKEIKETIDIIKHSAQTAQYILDDLMTWSRSISQKVKINPENLSLREIADYSINQVIPTAKKKDISINNLITPEIFVYADRVVLNIILRNLIFNAIKFSYPNSSIWISSEPSEKFVTISVKDTGIGIETERLEKLLNLGETKSTNGTQGETGTGLGLQICKEYVKQSGGQLWVSSELGKGSTFYFNLPLVISQIDIQKETEINDAI